MAFWLAFFFFFFSSRRRHTRYWRDWSSDVCSSDLRVEPVARPRALTSLNSAAHCALVSGGGAAERNCEELCTRNGRTLPTHPVGSSSGVPVVGDSSGCQCPTSELGTHALAPNRPSPVRAACITRAASWPTATPCLVDESSPKAPSEDAYAEVSAFRSPARPGNGTRSGADETSSTSTSYAAVATAASTEALAPARV